MGWLMLISMLCLWAASTLLVEAGDPIITFEWKVTYGDVAPLGVPVKGGFGGLRIHSRPLIPVPYDPPADEFTVMVGDWFNKGYTSLKKILDKGRNLGRADGIHINGKNVKGDGKDEPLFTMEAGKTYSIETGTWSPEKRMNYNLLDAVSRHTIQVFPKSWAAVFITFDNAGMWNIRSEVWDRHYLGQQLYFSSLSPNRSLRDEYNMRDDTPVCGIVEGMPKPPPFSS
ncbi:hypothetical protein V6N13_031029 [Hibiscus sabdariffa]